MNFFCNLIDLIKHHKSDILILVEAKTTSARVDMIMRSTHFDSITISETNGFVGRIWTFCNSTKHDFRVGNNGSLVHKK